MRTVICTAAGIMVTLTPTLAHGQEAAESETDADIIITAQRRAERLVDVPISITTLSADELRAAGVRSTEDLTAAVPGLNFATNGAFAQPTIRGIGTTVSAPGNDANVAIYVDGVYQPNQIGNFSELVDLERVEVLKGPQGTLFGRNATGGAIRIQTLRPGFELGGHISASYGRFDELRLSGYVTTGLSDKIAVSVGGFYNEDSGYATNLGTGNRVADSEAWSVRGKLMFEPSDIGRVTIALSHSDRSSNPPFTLGVLNGNSNVVNLPGSIKASGPREVSLTFDPDIAITQTSASLTAELDLGFAGLTTITSYQRTENDLSTDVDRTNLALVRADLPQEQETISQEVNLVSSGEGPFKWFAGVFYYADDAQGAVIVNNGAVFNTTYLSTEAIAPFAEINLELGRFTLIAGARYNSETKRFLITRAAARQSDRETFTNFTPRLGARFALSDQANVYATYSKGFKSGTFDGVLAAGQLVVNPVEPETVEAFEAGLKYGRGRTNFSVAGFYYDYTNIQFQAFNPNAGGLTQVFNAAAATIYGAEAEVSVSPVENLNLRGSIAWTHSEYDSFPNATVFCPRGAPLYGNATIPIGAVNPCTGEVNSDGATGKQLIRTPEFTASFSADYRIPVGSGAVEMSGAAFYSGAFFWDPNNRLKEPSYVLLNAELAYAFSGDRLRLSVWGRNLADELYALYTPESAGGDSVAYARPRTFGVAARLRF